MSVRALRALRKIAVLMRMVWDLGMHSLGVGAAYEEHCAAWDELSVVDTIGGMLAGCLS